MSKKKRGPIDVVLCGVFACLIAAVVGIAFLSVLYPARTLTVVELDFGGDGLFTRPSHRLKLRGEQWWQGRRLVVPESTWLAYEVGDVWEGMR